MYKNPRHIRSQHLYHQHTGVPWSVCWVLEAAHSLSQSLNKQHEEILHNREADRTEVSETLSCEILFAPGLRSMYT